MKAKGSYQPRSMDPTKYKDFQIAQEAMKHLPPPEAWAEKLGLKKEELIPFRGTPKLDFIKIIDRLKDKQDGKYVEVTAITPTPLGEGKTTVSMGLIQGLGVKGKNVVGVLRQPSGGPTMNVKGTAAGGGNALLIPMTEFSLGLTGDINDIMNAHNLAMVALTSRYQHECNYTDDELTKRGLRRLDIDPKNVEMGWIIDFCAQALRNITIGLGGKKDGYPMQSKFGIAVSSELMAILAVSRDLADMRDRIGKITVAYDRTGKPITTTDLDVAGAMTAWMRNTINPTLCYSVEGQPVLIHAGPFANIAIGQSSIIGDRVALKMFDYHVTESGFAADIGFEKFWNVKCRLSRTSRTSRSRRDDPRAEDARRRPEGRRGAPPDANQGEPRAGRNGAANLAHDQGVKKADRPGGLHQPVPHDTKAEHDLVRRICAAAKRVAASNHWMYGGEGAAELADTVMDACKEKSNYKPLYPLTLPLRQRVEMVAKEVYGADGVSWAPLAEEKAKRFEGDPHFADFQTMMVKTHLSLTHDPTLKGVPKGWTLPIRDVLVYSGAKFLCPMAGDISLMPGTASDPAYRRVDVDVNTGEVSGLF
jgi:formate--tetrahydrofolate ligase